MNEPGRPGSFTVRRAAPGDSRAIGDLLAVSYPTLMAEAYDADALEAALPLMTRANTRLLAGDSYYLAEAPNGLVVGCGGWSHEEPGSGKIEPGLAHIRHFATHPDWTGKGVGRALAALCERDCRAAGITKLSCFSSLNAVGFYKAVGFVENEPIRLRMSPTVVMSGVHMVRDLCPAAMPQADGDD